MEISTQWANCFDANIQSPSPWRAAYCRRRKTSWMLFSLLILRRSETSNRSAQKQVSKHGSHGLLTTAEVTRIWLQIVWPQVVFLLAGWPGAASLRSPLNAGTVTL